MSEYTNIGAAYTGTQADTTGFFNNFGSPTYAVSENVNDAILGYFESVTGNPQSAAVLASAVIYTSLQNGANPMNIIADFQKLEGNQLTLYLTTFLNLSRVGTSYLAVNNLRHVNQYIQRSILV
jgi:hypothetical protein